MCRLTAAARVAEEEREKYNAQLIRAADMQAQLGAVTREVEALRSTKQSLDAKLGSSTSSLSAQVISLFKDDLLTLKHIRHACLSRWIYLCLCIQLQLADAWAKLRETQEQLDIANREKVCTVFTFLHGFSGTPRTLLFRS